MKLAAPENVTGCSFDAVEYTVDAEGMVDVPDEAVEALAAFGFAPPQAKPAKGKKAEG